jgi:uncharacterized alkaline shock family protein YloU
MMMLSADEKNELGLIKIHNNVIASIAYLAALDVEGVSRICDDIKSRVLNMIGKKTQSGAIAVQKDKSDQVVVILPLIVKYGYNIPEIATKVQEKVKAAIEEATDLTPREIIIKIKGVEK